MEVGLASPLAGPEARRKRAARGRPAQEVTLRLPLDGRAPAAARAGVREYLHGRVAGAQIGDLELLVSELVANSLLHSGARAAGVLVRLELTPDAVRVEVEDEGHGDPIAPRPPDRDGGGGYGLHLVAALSDRWGVERGAPRGTRVWALLARDR